MFSVSVFASLFCEKVVGTSYSKFELKDRGGGKNVENAARNLPSSLLFHYRLLHFLIFYWMLLADLIC